MFSVSSSYLQSELQGNGSGCKGTSGIANFHLDLLDRCAHHVWYVHSMPHESRVLTFALNLKVHACLSARTNMEPEFNILISSLRVMAGDWQLAGKSLQVELCSRTYFLTFGR